MIEVDDSCLGNAAHTISGVSGDMPIRSFDLVVEEGNNVCVCFLVVIVKNSTSCNPHACFMLVFVLLYWFRGVKYFFEQFPQTIQCDATAIRFRAS